MEYLQILEDENTVDMSAFIVQNKCELWQKAILVLVGLWLGIF